jgi:putative ABC transport system permease protein
MNGLMLARRSAGHHKLRTVLAVAGVAVIGALNFDMLLLSRGLLLSFANLMTSVNFDVRVVGGAGFPMSRRSVTGATKLVEDIRALPEVEDVVMLRAEQAAAGVPGRPERTITFVGTTESATAGTWTLIKGADLAAGRSTDANDPPVIVSERLARLFGLAPGSILRIRVTPPGSASAMPAFDSQVVGLADFNFEAADEYTVATTMDGFRTVSGGDDRDEADLVLVASRPSAGPDNAVAAIAHMRPDLRAYSNEQVITEFNRTGFTYFRQISFVLSVTTTSFVVLLVATLLTVSVNQRLGEIAALRAIGISQRRIAAMLTWESALLVGVGGTSALPIGWALATALDRILRSMPGLPERLHFFVLEPRAFVLHFFLLTATAILAAAYPVWLAVRLPIAATLRREVIS